MAQFRFFQNVGIGFFLYGSLAAKRFIQLILFICANVLFGQQVVKFSLQNDRETWDAPVSISLDGFNYNTDNSNLALYEILPQGEKLISSQLEAGHSARLWFILDGITQPNTQRTFVLKQEQVNPTCSNISVRNNHQDLSVLKGEKPVFTYRFAMTYPPKGVDPIYKRSGFIHPVWSPGGEVLSRIQPPDHYHHYGIWGPWTKTTIDGREVDFWNLSSGQGTVRFAEFLSKTEGDIFSGFKALQQHIDFAAKGEDQLAMNEILDLRVWNNKNGVWIIDYTTTLNSPLPNGIMLNAFRYGGGLGFRATEKWHKDNCTVLTSEGKTRIDADGSSARWCIVEGESDTPEGRSGILFLSHPSNRMHPEPMRVWPLDANGGRGDMFFEFCPIRHNEWKLEPRQDYTLKYRMIVFDGKMDPQTAEKYWNSFATMPRVEILNR
jgi:hypothetical protein